MSNKQIAKLLRNVAASYTIKNEKKFRFQILAYQKAADSIENSSAEVVDLAKEGRLMEIPGIGPTIKEHLEELVKKKKVKHFNWVLKDIPKSVFPLTDIPTFGPKKAYKLTETLKLKNEKTVIEDIKKAAIEGKIAKIPGFGKKSEQDILKAIEGFKKGEGKTKRMNLPYAWEVADTMISYLRKNPAVLEAYPLGSLRRMRETIGDVDIAVSSSEPKKVIEYFVSYPYIERLIEKGDTTSSMIVSGGKQIDLMIMPPDRLGSLLQHFTGSKEHNVHLREVALKKGLSLSEYGIKEKRSKKLNKFKTEEEFYKFLEMQWIPPELREDKGEIEKALLGKLPKIVELSDIKGDLHIHSSFPIEPSHDMGKNSIEEMVKKAISLGYEYIGFSEHNPSVSKHNSREVLELIKRRNEEIDKIASKYKITILKLMETDILTNGSLALDEKALDLLDATLVSIHSAFSLNTKDMTKRILKGFSHPKAKILTHPTGRLINIREGYKPDFSEIFSYAKKHNKAIEINAYPTRLDLSDGMVFEATKQNIKMVIDTDAHETSQMTLMKYGVAVARRGWAAKKDVLNTLPHQEFVSWIKN